MAQPRYDTPDDVMKRLKRIETKVTIGFERMGIDFNEEDNWMTLESKDVVILHTMTRSLKAIREEAKRLGATLGGNCEVIYGRDTVAWI